MTDSHPARRPSPSNNVWERAARGEILDLTESFRVRDSAAPHTCGSTGSEDTEARRWEAGEGGGGAEKIHSATRENTIRIPKRKPQV